MRKPPCPPLPLALEHLEDRRLLAVVPWAGDIPDGTVWRAGDVQHLTADVRVPAGATLTVQPGAVVKFGSFSVDLVIAGTLAASGTSGQPIVFTEFRDDIAGGDTNGDGANSLPSPSNWGRIEVRPTGSATLAHAQIRYGGFNSLGQVTVDGGQLALTDSIISRSASDGVRIQASQPTLTNNAYLDNGNAALSMDLASNPAISGVTATGNPINGLQVDGGNLSGQRFWNDPDITYFTDGDITVTGGSKLTVAPGQVVKFGSFSYDLLVEGTLDAQGTAGAPIVFTEFRDDSAGGDTNNNGTATAPSASNWGRIELSGPANVMSHVHLRYGGFNSAGELTVAGGELTFQHGSLDHAANHGLRVTTAHPTIQDVVFRNNAGAAISLDLASNPAITGSSPVVVTNNAINGALVDSGELPQDGFWNDPDIVYVTNGDITVPAGKKLTIGAGQVVKFGSFFYDLFVAGTLDAQGTAAAPIVLTELRDDTGGDTNNNQAATLPSPSNWGRVEVQPTGSATLAHAQIRYGGFNSLGQVTVDGGQLALTDSTISRSASDGVRIQASQPTLTNNAYLDNGNAALSMDLASNPAISGVTISGNPINGLQVDGGTLNGQQFWNDPDITYVTDGDIFVASAAKLTVAPGQVVKFGSFFYDLFVAGTLDAQGTVVAPIVFTEFRDDSAGGDTNNNGAATIPSAGNWGRIELSGPANAMSHVHLRYGGFNSAGELTVAGGELTFAHGSLDHAANHGLRVTTAHPTIQDVVFRNNAGAAISLDLASNPAITGSSPVVATNNAINGALVDAGELPQDGFWNDPDIVYVTNGDITVPAGKKLTIGAGQVVKFGSFFYDLFVAGTLDAQGTAAAPIVLTELRDDTGGDTNNNQAATLPSSSNWGRVEVQPTGSATLAHAQIRYGGFNSLGQVTVDGGQLALTDSTISRSASDGVRIQASQPTLTNNAYLDNGNAALSMDLASNPAISGVTISGNPINGLQVDGGTLNGQQFWNDPDITYVTDGDIIVASAAKLTVAPGQVVKFGSFFYDLFVEGTLDAQGTVATPIVFTEFRDDSAGGDTNNDGNNSDPAPGNWGHVALQASSVANLLDHVEVRYGGFNATGIIQSNGGPLQFRNGVIRRASGSGVFATGGSQVSVTNSLLLANGQAGVAVASGATLTAVNNTIDGNFRGAHADGATSTLILTNNLLTFHGRSGVFRTNSATIQASFNDFFNPTAEATNYEGLANLTDVDGNFSADPLYVSRTDLRYDLLRRSPALDTADSNVAPATDSQGKPRFNDPGVDDLGVGPIKFVDLGALERQDVSDPLNLVIESPGVSAAQVQIDDTVTIQWTVRNNEFVTAEGSWVDAVFVSQDDRWDLGDTLVHRSTHTGGLAPGQAYAGQAQFLVPPKREGTLYFLIRTDSQRALRESAESDNEAVVSSQLTIPELIVGTAANSSFTATATRRFFRITPPDNRTVEFHLDSAAASGTTGLYVREGALPSLTEFDAKGTAPGPDQDATVPESGGRTIYLLAQAGAGPAAIAAFALSAELPGFQVREVTPAVVGNAGNVTLQIRGTDLTRITEVTLISSDNVVVPAVATYFGDANQLFATFNLTGMTAGHFHVRVHSAAPYADFSETGQLIIRTQTDGDVTLADAVEVRAVSSNSATVNLLLPSVARFGQVIPFHVEVRNDGINDIPIPVILVRSANGTPLSTSSIVSATSPTQLQILPLGDEGPPTVLRPGASLRIPLFGLAIKEPASQIAVQTMPSDATAIPWDSYEATYRDDTPAAEWSVTWSNFKTMVGGTLESLHLAMRHAAEELATARRAATFVSADEVIKLLLNYARAGETSVANFLSFPTGMDDPDPLGLLNPPSPQGEWGPVGTAPQPEPESDPPAGDNRDTCASWRPRSAVVLAAMEAWAETAVIAAVSARNGTFASSLFVEYLQNSSPKYEAYPSSHVIVQGNPLHEGFKDSSVTLNVIQTVWDDAIREIKRRLTPGLWGTIPADKRLDINTMGSFETIPLESIFRPEQLDSALSPFSTQREGANPAIYYADALHYGGDGDTFSIPNAIAGGVGKTDPDESPRVSYGSDQFGDDRRKITGEIILRKTTSPDGQTVTITAESLFRLFVKDTVDFCPGDLGEGLPVRAATVPLKSLEANGWAFDVGFETEFATKGLSSFVVRKNVTEPPTSCELNSGTQGGEGEASSCTDTGQTVQTVRSRDPNDITGPAGFGDQGWILPETLLPYKVRFENDPQQATAPALDVVVTNQLDSDMDWSTFELGSIGFSSLVVDVPPGLSSYSTSVESANLDGTPLRVAISAMLNADTGLVTVSFRSIDPATGLPPLDPLAGFLPPNDTTHRGEGFFTYFVFPKSGLATGTRLENAASIVFDTNDPIVTNTALNTIDRGPPSSQVNALPATSVTPFVVTWTGTDDAGGSGIASYDIYVSDNGGSFALFLDDTTNTSTSFAGIAGHTYQFYSIATDNLGFVEVPPAQPDAQTTAATGPAWQNPRNRRDPTNDGNVVPQDVLVIVNELNQRRFSNPVTGQLGPRTADAQFYYDVNGDNFATPNDVLVIVNFLNAGGGEGEPAESASAQDTATWWLGAALAMSTSTSSVPPPGTRAPSPLPRLPGAHDDVFAEWPDARRGPLSDLPTGGPNTRVAKGLPSTRTGARELSDMDTDTDTTEVARYRAPRRHRTSDTP